MTLLRSLCGECRLTLARAVSARNGPQGRAPGRVVATLLLVIALLRPELFSQQLSLPIQPNSLKFAVIGDNGTGDQPEYDVGARMVDLHRIFPFDMVIMLGDNMYGSQQPADFVQKFAKPYAPLLSGGVRFFAALGNHDRQSNTSYVPFNMGGERYYTYVRGTTRFFVLDSNYFDPAQRSWIEGALKAATEDWKICYFHHPLYSDGRRHGSEVELRVQREPLLVKYGVQVVFSGHDHIYERIKPQQGIHYFVSGAAGQLRKGDVSPSAMTAAYFDQDRSFMLVEIAEQNLFFEAISRTGKTVDSGVTAMRFVVRDLRTFLDRSAPELCQTSQCCPITYGDPPAEASRSPPSQAAGRHQSTSAAAAQGCGVTAYTRQVSASTRHHSGRRLRSVAPIPGYLPA